MFTGPRIDRKDLALQIDMAKQESLPDVISQKDISKQDHGLSEWYCFFGGNVTYAAPYPETIIHKIDGSTGAITEVVGLTQQPQRGTFTVNAGNRYFATKPVHFMVQNQGHYMVPISLKGKYFGHYSYRGGVTKFYAYCPEGSGTVSFYDNVVGGVTGTATSSLAISEGQQITFSSSTTESVPMIFESDVDIIMCATENDGNDDVIMAPAATDIYFRRGEHIFTINNTTPSRVAAQYRGDTLPCISVGIADGAGLEAEQFLGLENLSNSYAFGMTLSDYQIVAPYPNTQVRVLYYENGWQLADTHNLNGTQTNPDSIFMEGNTGFGSPGNKAYDDGKATKFISNTTELWRWESNQPILLVVNDASQDEELVLGWMSSRTERNTIKNIQNTSHRTKISGRPRVLNTNHGIMEFDGVDDYLHGPSVLGGATEYTIITTFKIRNISGREDWLFSHYDGSVGRMIFDVYSDGRLRHFVGGTAIYSSQTIQENVWYQVATTRDSSGNAKIYINGVEDGSGTIATTPIADTDYEIGGTKTFARWFDGYIGQNKVFKKKISEKRIKRIFRAFRGRFKI